MFAKFLASEYNTIGIIGVVCILGAYLLLQIDRLSQDSLWYSLLNLVGAILVLISLLYS